MKNPRKPNRLTFENFRFGKINTAGFEKLRKDISDFELAVISSAEAMTKEALPVAAERQVDAMDIDTPTMVKSGIDIKQGGAEAPRKVLSASKEQVADYMLATHFLSPASSGVFDEVSY